MKQNVKKSIKSLQDKINKRNKIKDANRKNWVPIYIGKDKTHPGSYYHDEPLSVSKPLIYVSKSHRPSVYLRRNHGTSNPSTTV